MHDPKRHSLSAFHLLFALALAAGLVLSCSERPTSIEREPAADPLAGSGSVDPGTGGSFMLGSVRDTVDVTGRIEVWAKNVAFDPATGIVSLDVQLFNRTRRDIHPPLHFVVTDIVPPDISVMEFDGVSWDGKPFYDFSSKLGDDGVLEAGGWTEHVTMMFHTVTARSFAIGFRIETGWPGGNGVIAGVVFRDINRNGVRDTIDFAVEPGISGITIALEKPLSSGDIVVLFARTDRNGEYCFSGLRAGVYEVSVHVFEREWWEVTSANPLLVTLITGPDGGVQPFTDANFGLYPMMPPVPTILFGPIPVGPASPFGTVVDSVFVDEPTVTPVVYSYYLDVHLPPYMGPYPMAIDTASAWINDVQVFAYHREPSDTISFQPQTVLLPDTLVVTGQNEIRLVTDGNEHALLLWRVYKKI